MKHRYLMHEAVYTMLKTLLVTLIPTLFIWADVKTPYTIQDENTQIATGAANELFSQETTQVHVDYSDNELIPMEHIFDMPDEDPTEEIKKANKIEEKKPEIPKKIEKERLEAKKSTQKVQKSQKELEIERIRKELDIKGPTPRELKLKKIKEELDIKEPTVRSLRIDSVREELNIGYKVPKNETTFDRRVDDIKEGIDAISVDNAVSGIKSTLGMKSKKKDTGFFLTDSLSTFGDTIGMDIGIPGMPDFLGFGGSKKKESGILDSVMGFGFLGDIKDTGTSMYKGAKYSGQSAEMMSGMMYNSSKMYNNMFGMFDDSPFNMFEEEEEASMFDVLEHGNTVMDMFNY